MPGNILAKQPQRFSAKDKKTKSAWISTWSHQLKHKQGAVGRLLNELSHKRSQLDKKKNWLERDEEFRLVIGYYTNNKHRMRYAYQLKHNLPMGSGVTEAACKTLIKQCMCLSGSRWKDSGASCVLALRALKLTKGRWQQFWAYVMRHGTTVY